MIRILLFVFIIAGSAYAQGKGAWVTGKSSAYGTDLKKMQNDAVKRARADALNQAGIVVSASSYRVQTETNKEMNDYYSQFTEATSRGIITQERNVRISDPKRITSKSAKDDAMFQVEAELEAYVIIPEGAADPGFSVQVTTKRTSYRENEPVLLEITPSKQGYLTIFQVKNDTIQIVFPNALSRDNLLSAKQKFIFPKGFELLLTVDGDEKSTNEEFIAVVTKEEIPIAAIGEAIIVNDEMILPKLTLTDLSSWLSKIPLNQRTMDHKVLTAVK